MEETKRNSTLTGSSPGLFRAVLAGLAAFILSGLVVIAGIYLLQNELIRNEQKIGQEKISNFRVLIENAITRCQDQTSGLDYIIRNNPGIDEATFSKAAEDFLGNRPWIRQVTLSSDANLLFTHVFPPADSPGTTRHLLRIPVLPSGSGTESAHFHLDLDIDAVLLLDSLLVSGELRFAMTGLNGSSPGVFWGDTSVLDSLSLVVDVATPHGTWKLYASPISGWATNSPLLLYFFLFGCGLALFIGILTAILVRTRQVLQNQVFQDYLTQLPNRALFEDRVAQVLNRAERANERAVIFVLDLDGFRQINDRQGFSTGDQLLALVARRLHDGLRRTDTIARIGADEFAILASLEQESGLSVVNNRIRACFQTPFDLETMTMKMDISLGHALFPEDGRTTTALFRVAEERMGRMKRSKAG